MTQNSAEELWSIVLGELQVQVSRANYDTWLRDTKGLALTNNTFVVGAPTTFATEWLSKRLTPLVRKTITRVREQDTDIRFTVLDPAGPAAAMAPATAPAASAAARHVSGNGSVSLNARYSFNNFVVGGPNRFAHAAAVAVSDCPGEAYNPLFLYGGVGLGKTHLLHAVGQRARDRGLHVLYITSEQFTNQFINSLRERTTEEFRAKYRGVDVLLIDDIQFIADKEQTQESFFHTFNDLHTANRQIVISSDRSPRSMPLLEDRLRSRFEWGLIADVQPPDLEMRIAILQARCEETATLIGQDVLDLIAHRFVNNIRELEGAFNRVVAFCQITDSTPTLPLAEQALADLLHKSGLMASSPEAIIGIVAANFQLTPEEILGPRRSKDIAHARQVAMYLLRTETTLSYSDIGRELGNRDHSTILHGFGKISSELEQNTRLRRTIGELSTALRSGRLKN